MADLSKVETAASLCSCSSSEEEEEEEGGKWTDWWLKYCQ